MKTVKSIFTGAGLIFFLALLPNTASARVNFHIGFGTGIGHRHSGFYSRCYPHYGLHGGYYRWPGRGRYRGHSVFGHRNFHGHRPRHSSGVSVWIDGLFPIVVRRPVVVETPNVITESHVVIEEPEYYNNLRDDENTAELFEKLRRKKSELLKVLRIGDKAKCKEAIRELAGFSFDDKVREALEDVLLKDPDPELRREAAESLGKTSNKKVLRALEKANADDPNREVRQEAYKSIIKIRGYRL